MDKFENLLCEFAKDKCPVVIANTYINHTTIFSSTMNRYTQHLSQGFGHETYWEDAAYLATIFSYLIKIADTAAYNKCIVVKGGLTKETYILCLLAIGDIFINAWRECVAILGPITPYKIAIIKELISISLNHYVCSLEYDIYRQSAKDGILSILLSQINRDDVSQSDEAIIYLKLAEKYFPESALVSSYFGLIYNLRNDIEMSIIYYKRAIALNIHTLNITSKDNIYITVSNMIAVIYREMKQPLIAQQILLDAIANYGPNHSDLHTTLGLVYCESGQFELAEAAYNVAIANCSSTYDLDGEKSVLSAIYTNLGQMHFAMGDNVNNIRCNEKGCSIQMRNITYQNTLLSMINEFLSLSDKMDIKRAHLKINDLYNNIRFTKPIKTYTFDAARFNTPYIEVGLVSSDFGKHVVFSFISSYIEGFYAENSDIRLTCYVDIIPSENTLINSEHIRYKVIRAKSAREIADIIYTDNIHILLDLNGNTGKNRLDVFSLRPAPVQVSYIGYAYTTGLAEMDYRITDAICDREDVSQKFYSEKLIFMKDCFLGFNSNIHLMGNPVPIPTDPPYLLNREFLTIGCFSRADKYSVHTTDLYNSIMSCNPKIKFIFKALAFSSEYVRDRFLARFSPNNRDRISFIEYCGSNIDHLLCYNNIDISVDTFPYSGTTTCCDALLMGTPLYSLYDSEYFFHAHNVSCSILRNSHEDFNEFIIGNKCDIHARLENLRCRSPEFWRTMKIDIQRKFLQGNVCNTSLYSRNLSTVFRNLFISRKSEISTNINSRNLIDNHTQKILFSGIIKF